MQIEPIKKRGGGRGATEKPLQKYASEVELSPTHEEERALEQIRKRLSNRSKTKLSFPVEVFPKRLQNVIECFKDCFSLPVDYHASGILAAASVAVGNGFAARYKRGQVLPCVVWIAVVGYPSSGKSPGIDFGLYPLYELEDDFRQEFSERLTEWKRECAEAIVNSREEPPRPLSKDILLNNATMEAINSAMNRNPQGLLMFQDEFKAWILNMNSYRAGSDLEAWLSIWSGKSSKISRTGKDPIWIKNPYVSVIGNIQPGVLSDLASGGKMENGFTARVLFAYPDDMECPEESEKEPDESVYELYRGIIKFLHDLPTRLDQPDREGESTQSKRIEVPLSTKAKARYMAFLNDYSIQMNSEDDEKIKGILGKLKQYCLRLSLLLQMLDVACHHAPEAPTEEGMPSGYEWEWGEISLEEVEKIQITESCVERAIVLTEYFRETSYKVLDRLDSLVGSLPFHQQLLYKELPYEFTTAQMRKIADGMIKMDDTCKLSDKTLERLRGNKQLCLKIGRGSYKKLF